jgi:hypothetical protein
MNERIQKLAEQAGIQLPNNLVEGVNGPGVISPKDKLEKFAELIVRECANVAADHDALDIYEQIREHFGVEE